MVRGAPSSKRSSARAASIAGSQFLGHREDVAQLLAEADVFVLPSRSEAFPNGAIEAMAAGLPVVASAAGGLLDLIEHGHTGLLFEPGNAEALADALRHLFTDRGIAAGIGQRAQAQVRQRYSFERMVRSFEDLYVASLPARRSRRRARAGRGYLTHVRDRRTIQLRPRCSPVSRERADRDDRRGGAPRPRRRRLLLRWRGSGSATAA